MSKRKKEEEKVLPVNYKLVKYEGDTVTEIKDVLCPQTYCAVCHIIMNVEWMPDCNHVVCSNCTKDECPVCNSTNQDDPITIMACVTSSPYVRAIWELIKACHMDETPFNLCFWSCTATDICAFMQIVNGIREHKAGYDESMRDGFPARVGAVKISLERSPLKKEEREAVMAFDIDNEYQEYFLVAKCSQDEIIQNIWKIRDEAAEEDYVVIANDSKLSPL